MKRSLFLILLLAIVLVLAIGGAYAQWIFSDLTMEPKDNGNALRLSPFMYTPEEILPDEEETSELQKNHLELLHNILYHQKYGLNYSNTLDNAIDRYLILRSQENISGGNLKHLFTTRESELLDFVIQYASETEYVLYTFEDDALESGTINSSRIPTYKIVLVYENGEWVAGGAVKGHAIIRQFTTSNNKKYRTIHPEDFVPGKLAE